MQNTAPGRATPHDGFVVEVGGKFNSEHGSLTAALKAGLELKNKNSQIPVRVCDANERA